MNIMKERSILVVKDWITVATLVKTKKNVIKLFIVGWSDQLENQHHIDCWVAPYTSYSSFRFKGPWFNSWTGPVQVRVHLQFEINNNKLQPFYL